MKRYITLLLMLISAAASAQKLTVEAPNVVAMDETFRIIFTAEGNMSDFDWPGLEDFQIVWGPQKGSMSSTTIVNGKRESVHQESCTYILQPTKEGKFTIPAATCTIDKKSCSSGSVTIEVVGAQQQASGQTQQQSGGTSSQGQQSQDSQNSDPAVTGTVSNQDIFMRLTLSKTNVMKGEPITGVLKFYTRTDIAGFEDVKFPTFNGFWSKETYTPQNIEFNRESVDGKIYNVAVIRRYMLIPQQEGRITIDPAEMVCQVRVRTTGGGRSIFDDFFDNYQTIRKRVSTGAVTVNVKGLPAGAPASFKGGVGEYRISAQMSADSVKTNEAASLKITIAGNGNISMLEAPKVEFPGDFEVYDIKSTENVTANGASGTKTFEYPFIPRSYGDFKIGPINYSYYDVQKGQYVTVSAPEMNFKVIRGEGYDEGGVIVPGTVRQSVKNIGEDVRFIHTGNPGLRDKGKFFVLSPLFWGLIALIALLFFILSSALKAVAERRSDVVGTRTRKASKMARGRLKAAGDYLQKGLGSAFYEELHKAVLGYVSDKLSIPVADLSKDYISETLAAKGVAAELTEALTDVLDACEQARYSPSSSSEEMTGQYNRAVNVISDLEGALNVRKNMKNNSSKGVAVAIAAMLLSTSTFASWENGNAAFTEGNYEAALSQYLELEAAGQTSAPLCYNIGNTYYRLGDVPHAVLYYKRALKLNPGYADAKNNLAIAQGAVLDKIEAVPDFILVTWINNIKYTLSSNAWGWITIALLFVAMVLMLGFRLLGTTRGRKSSFIVACVVALFAIVTLIFSLSERNDAISQDSAVVMIPVSSVKSSPGDAGKSLFILHDGTCVDILDVLGDWTRIELADGRQGWIPSADIAPI